MSYFFIMISEGGKGKGELEFSWLQGFRSDFFFFFFFGSYQYYQVKERKKNGEEGQDPIQ